MPQPILQTNMTVAHSALVLSGDTSNELVLFHIGDIKKKENGWG